MDQSERFAGDDLIDRSPELNGDLTGMVSGGHLMELYPAAFGLVVLHMYLVWVKHGSSKR